MLGTSLMPVLICNIHLITVLLFKAAVSNIFTLTMNERTICNVKELPCSDKHTRMITRLCISPQLFRVISFF